LTPALAVVEMPFINWAAKAFVAGDFRHIPGAI
jgi:hypothetical protein